MKKVSPWSVSATASLSSMLYSFITGKLL